MYNRPGGEQWLARLAWMAGFGHVMKIFIGAGLCGCLLQCLFSHILLFNDSSFNLTTGIRAMVWLGYARWCFYVH